MNKSIQWITRTAILLALTLLFQSLRVLIPIPPNISQYLIGSLVNLSLIVAAVMVGMTGGLLIAVLTPLIAFMQGFLPPFPIMILLIALGNAVLVIVAASLYRRNPLLAVGLGALLKFGALFIGVVNIAVPFLLTNAPQGLRNTLSVQFSWPQLITALLGGILALAVIPVLQRTLER